MTVSLFSDQLVLDVPDDTRWISFERMPETIDFCLPFYSDRSYILTSRDSTYFFLDVGIPQWYITDKLHHGCYDATSELLQLIQQTQPYEYW